MWSQVRPLLTEVRDAAARNLRMHRTVPQQIIWPHDRSDKVEKRCSGAFKELGTGNSVSWVEEELMGVSLDPGECRTRPLRGEKQGGPSQGAPLGGAPRAGDAQMIETVEVVKRTWFQTSKASLTA